MCTIENSYCEYCGKTSRDVIMLCKKRDNSDPVLCTRRVKSYSKYKIPGVTRTRGLDISRLLPRVVHKGRCYPLCMDRQMIITEPGTMGNLPLIQG